MADKNSNTEITLEEFNYSFIPEKPIVGDIENPLKFGHDEIVDTLDNIIRNAPKENSLTIGLYGNWGSGKSTIATSLMSKLSKEKIPLIIFDVWKHEGDGLRRTFLNHLDNILRKVGIKANDEDKAIKYLPNDFELNKSLNRDSSEETEDNTYDYIGALLFLVKFYVGGIILLIIGWLIIDKGFAWYDITKADISSVVKAIIALVPISLLIEKAVQKSRSVTLSKVYNQKFKDPIEFTNEFNNLLNAIKSEIIVIVFDNLDRVSGEKAVEIISTIKTFLEPIDEENTSKQVVFIIPCDDTAIKKHLRSVFQKDQVDTTETRKYIDEYLRKFFNTIIRIPAFNVDEMEDFTWQLLVDTEIQDFQEKELSSLITSVFKDNPRQVIQFINSLIANYLLLRERETKKDNSIEEGFLEKNTLQLAKYLLLVQNFPEIMQKFQTKLIYDLDYFTRDTIIGHKDEYSGAREIRYIQNEFDSFERFLDGTPNIYIDSLEIFFKFRRTKSEQAFPNSSRLIKMIDKNDFKELKGLKDEKTKEQDEKIGYIESLKLSDKLKEFGNVINLKLEEKKTNPVDVCKFINGVFYLTNYEGITLPKIIYQNIAGKINIPSINSFINHIDPNIVKEEFMDKYKTTGNKTNRSLIDLWANDTESILKDEE